MGSFSSGDLEYMFWNGLRNGSIGTVGAKGDPGGLVQTDLLTTDLATLTTIGGAYMQPNSGNATTVLGYPYNGFIGSILVLKRGTDRTTQIAYPQTGAGTAGNVFYVRVNGASGFGSWQAFNGTRVDQTAGRAIYQWDPVNNREQLIYGDTGLRDVVADIKNPNAWLCSSLYIQRKSGFVTINAYGVNRNGSTDTWVAQLPLGFRPDTWTRFIAAVPNTGTTFTGEIDSTGYIALPMATTACTFTYTFPTNNNWPTSLPGTANGTIPNL